MGTKVEEKSCNTCIHRCMDMDLDPYCAAPAVLEKHPYGLVLHRGTPPECLKDGVRTAWVKDVRGEMTLDEMLGK